MRLERKIVVIVGPNASGKTGLAVKLAKDFNGEIVSVDSRQVYKGMDIGSGKDIGEKSKIKNQKSKLKVKSHKLDIGYHKIGGVPVWLLDIVEPNYRFGVFEWLKCAKIVIRDIFKRDKLAIICGGTGFWVKSFIDNLEFPEVKPNWRLRNELAKENVQKLYSRLLKIDEKRAKNIGRNNRFRLIRAIEICQSLGRVPQLKTGESDDDFLQIGISWPREILQSRILKRLAARFKQGMIKEVSELHRKGVSWRRLESFGLEYRWIARYLQGKIDFEEMKEKLLMDIKKYGKRQMTWFKKDKRIKWFAFGEEIDYQAVKDEVQRFVLL